MPHTPKPPNTQERAGANSREIPYSSATQIPFRPPDRRIHGFGQGGDPVVDSLRWAMRQLLRASEAVWNWYDPLPSLVTRGKLDMRSFYNVKSEMLIDCYTLEHDEEGRGRGEGRR